MFDAQRVDAAAEMILKLQARGIQVGVVIGGGNIWRGRFTKEMNGANADQMGMLATIINSLALQSALEDNGVKAKVLTSIRMEPIGEYYSKARAIEYLEAGYVDVSYTHLTLPTKKEEKNT